MREVDLLLGPFADTHMAELGDDDLADFEALLEVPDDLLLSWLVGKVDVFPEFRSRVFRLIVDFHARAHDQT